MASSGIDRRRKELPRLTVSQVVDKMQHVADVDYKGDLQNNILPIFNEMPPGDKRTYLRKSLLLHWEKQIELANNGMQDVVIDKDKDTRIDPSSVAAERKQISDFNYHEQVKLKSWLIKAFFLGSLMLIVAFTVTSVLVGTFDISKTAGQIETIIEILFGLT